jgi:NADH-quinone oxidoreductase subunit F
LEKGFNFVIEIRRGAGAYIAGEETALFNSIEGKRAEPRNKPPFPAQAGLFRKPTGVNNVETLLNVLEILTVGGLEFAKTGTESSTGTRLFCLSGAVIKPGLYEAPFGIKLGDIISLAGGIKKGKSIKAILLGGAAGSFVGKDQIDIPLSFEGVRSAGVTLGSGVVMVFDQDTDFEQILLRIAKFFREESCGQCVPCRVGTARQEEFLARLANKSVYKSKQQELELLSEVGMVMRESSICGLGQTASNAIESAFKLGLV